VKGASSNITLKLAQVVYLAKKLRGSGHLIAEQVIDVYKPAFLRYGPNGRRSLIGSRLLRQTLRWARI
jgi:hypothetical protein